MYATRLARSFDRLHVIEHVRAHALDRHSKYSRQIAEGLSIIVYRIIGEVGGGCVHYEG